MFQKLSAWFKAHNVNSHTIAAGLAVAGSAYLSNESFRNAVNDVLSHYPKVAAATATAFGIYLKYSTARKAIEEAREKAAGAAAGK